MRRRSQRTPLSRAARLTKEWLGFTTINTGSGAPSSVLLTPGSFLASWILTPEESLEFFDEPTLLRMLFNWGFAATASGSANEFNLVCAGVITCRETGAGPTPLHPLDDSGHNWIWTNYQWLLGSTGGVPALFNYVSPGADLWDIKTKRIVQPGEGLAFIFVNDASSASNVTVACAGRMLLAH